ncbi:MAG: COG1470 family protein [Thermoproteota archaeon]
MDSDGVARFALTLNNIGDLDERLNLTCEALNGWNILFKDQTRTIYEVILPASMSKIIQVEATPPADVLPGVYGFNASICSRDRVVYSKLDLNVVVLESSGRIISALYPDLSEEAGKTLNFPLTIRNLGTDSVIYKISTFNMPQGWSASFRTTPGGSSSISSISLGAKESSTLYLEVVPPNTVEVGTYTIPVQVKTESGTTYEIDLKATIIGSYSLRLSPSTLLTSVTSSASTTFTVKVTNDGHTSITGVRLNVEVPDGWDSSISPVSVALLEPSGSSTFTLIVNTPADAVAGDYMITLTGLSDQVKSDAVQVRVTVTAPTSWGYMGVGIAVLMIIALVIVFMKFRRR